MTDDKKDKVRSVFDGIADGKAPDVFVPKYRPTAGRIRHDLRVCRYWRHKETGEVVEVIRAMLVKPENKLRLVYLQELPGQPEPAELACWFSEMTEKYEEIGNMRAK